jgi:hypothetical protein
VTTPTLVWYCAGRNSWNATSSCNTTVVELVRCAVNIPLPCARVIQTEKHGVWREYVLFFWEEGGGSLLGQVVCVCVCLRECDADGKK